MGFGPIKDLFEATIGAAQDIGKTFTGGEKGLFGQLETTFEAGAKSPEGIFAATAGSFLGPGGTLAGLMIGGGLARANQRMARKATERATLRAQAERSASLQRQRQVIERNFRQRARSRGAALGASAALGAQAALSPGQQNASMQGTSLLTSQASMPSLFEGS